MSQADNPLTAPRRGFDVAEFEQRTARAQDLMAEAGMAAMLLTTEPEVRYFSGFHTQFWESPTRPWFLVVPASGKPIAAIPRIGAAGMAQTWVEDIRTWTAPNPGDDGVSLLANTLHELAGDRGRIGVPLGHESMLRMPAGDFLALRERLDGLEMVDARPLLRRLRVVKSEVEIEKIRYVCQLTSGAFEALPEKIAIGMTEREVCKALQLDILNRGADGAPYLMGSSGSGSYNNIIMGPSDRVLGAGDIMIIDTGATFDGYFCDFDRNYAFGAPSDAAKRAHEVTYEATDAGFAAAQPGMTTSDVWAAMWQVLETGGALGNDVGRMGHGLGMQLTEWPSNMPGDDTVLEPGMVLTLEPGMDFAQNQQMVHEENIVIREGGAEWLTRRAPAEMPVID
jgi:Xaa-Pro aminopeptidase